MKNKFYNFISKNNITELYLYGDIISGTEKYDETDICFKDFKDVLDKMGNNETLDIYINSGGGSVTATQAIIGLINKAKRDKDIKIRCTIDGIAGSCSSWLPMIADEVNCYNTSIMMIHKPMLGYFMQMMNADELAKDIDILNKMEDGIMIPAYMSKAKEGVSIEQIKDMLSKETWFTANEMCEIFNINLLENTHEMVAKVDSKCIENYKNIPSEAKKFIEDGTNNKDTNDKLSKEIEDKIKEYEIFTALNK